MEDHNMFEQIPKMENHYAYLIKIEEHYDAHHRESKINDICNAISNHTHMANEIKYNILDAVWDYR